MSVLIYLGIAAFGGTLIGILLFLNSTTKQKQVVEPVPIQGPVAEAMETYAVAWSGDSTVKDHTDNCRLTAADPNNWPRTTPPLTEVRVTKGTHPSVPIFVDCGHLPPGTKIESGGFFNYCDCLWKSPFFTLKK